MRKEVIGNATLFLGDCLEILPTLPKVDAVITDPPYGVGFQYASHDDRREGYADWCAQWFAELRRVSDVIAISCGVANLCNWPEPTWVYCWSKPNSMGRAVGGWNTWEPVLLYGKPMGKKGHDSFVVSLAPQPDTGDHPCPKPVGWAMELLDRVPPPGGSVLDCFLGSGTTGVSATMAGHPFIGIEREPKYFDIACRRIEQAYKQRPLFDAEPPRKPEQLGIDA
jgi:site-specific DNA-methyltransferase (adenine-specific)